MAFLAWPVWAWLPSSPFSDDASGTTGAAFLKIPVGARPIAMGEAHVAAVSGAEALFWNPAGLIHLEEASCSEISASYGLLLESSFHSALAYARPVKGSGVWGVGWNLFSQGAISSFNEAGDEIGTFTPQDMLLAVAYARRWGTATFGAAVKGIRSSLAGETGYGEALDLGWLFPNMDGKDRLDMGISLSNLGPKFRLGSESDPLPLRGRLGGALRVFSGGLFVMDLNLPVDRNPYLAVGGEYTVLFGPDMGMALRAGYNTGTSRGVEGLAGLTSGFGLKAGKFVLDYAWAPFGDLGTTHRISMTFRF